MSRRISRFRVTALLAGWVLAGYLAATAHAQAPVFGNFAVPRSGSSGQTLSANDIFTVRFLTGSFPVTVTSLQASMIAPGSVASFDLYTNNGGNRGSFLSTFGNSTLGSPNDYTFTPSTAIILAPNTVYHISSRRVSGDPFWYFTDGVSNPVAQNGSGIVFEQYRFSTNGGGAWEVLPSSLRFQLNGVAVVPEAGTLALVAAGFAVSATFVRRRRAA